MVCKPLNLGHGKVPLGLNPCLPNSLSASVFAYSLGVLGTMGVTYIPVCLSISSKSNPRGLTPNSIVLYFLNQNHPT